MKTTFLFFNLFFTILTALAGPPSPSLTISKSSFPRLFTDQNGNPVLSWIERTDANLSLVYRVSTDGGDTFGEPKQILLPPSTAAHGEDVPKLIFKRDGTRMLFSACRNQRQRLFGPGICSIKRRPIRVKPGQRPNPFIATPQPVRATRTLT